MPELWAGKALAQEAVCMFPVTLSGDRVALRELRDDDAEALFDIYGDDRVARWLVFGSLDLATITGLLERSIRGAMAEARTEYHLAVSVPGSGLVGSVRLGLNGAKAAKIAYAIRSDEWGNGYATDAARTLVGLGFETVGLHRISAAIWPENKASIAVADRLGMQSDDIFCRHRIRQPSLTQRTDHLGLRLAQSILERRAFSLSDRNNLADPVSDAGKTPTGRAISDISFASIESRRSCAILRLGPVTGADHGR